MIQSDIIWSLILFIISMLKAKSSGTQKTPRKSRGANLSPKWKREFSLPTLPKRVKFLPRLLALPSSSASLHPFLSKSPPAKFWWGLMPQSCQKTSVFHISFDIVCWIHNVIHISINAPQENEKNRAPFIIHTNYLEYSVGYGSFKDAQSSSNFTGFKGNSEV